MLSPKPAHRPSVASVLGRPYIKRSIKAIVAFKPRDTPSPDILSPQDTSTPPLAVALAQSTVETRNATRASDDEVDSEEDLEKTVIAGGGVAAAAAAARATGMSIPVPPSHTGHGSASPSSYMSSTTEPRAPVASKLAQPTLSLPSGRTGSAGHGGRHLPMPVLRAAKTNPGTISFRFSFRALRCRLHSSP
jgi:hypothetical protein